MFLKSTTTNHPIVRYKNSENFSYFPVKNSLKIVPIKAINKTAVKIFVPESEYNVIKQTGA
jgi:hypothetical protein